ncbi:hypothetical protein Tco_0704848 [Tanacetum coccineum]|uniref:Uncharacterized protein n=1 Tax=Tanacetum coccineum TaxID=301880 RepID=A0ABQ4Y4B5_9ASTR
MNSDEKKLEDIPILRLPTLVDLKPGIPLQNPTDFQTTNQNPIQTSQNLPTINGVEIGLHTNTEEQGYLILNKTTLGTSKELRDTRLGAGNHYYCTYGLKTLTIWYEEYDDYRPSDPSAAPRLENA